MGLDIYFHVGKGSNYDSVYASEKKRQNKNLRTAIKRNANKIIKNFNEATYTDDTIAMIKSLAIKYYYTFGYDHVIRKFVNNPVTKDKLVDFLIDNLVPCTEAREDAYFRKVNFLYQYFAGRIEDDETCEVTIADVEDIISRCNAVLHNKTLASDLLPTCGGFFFGSTNYDDWYISNVKDCHKQMKRLLKRMEKEPDSNCFVHFSW